MTQTNDAQLIAGFLTHGKSTKPTYYSALNVVYINNQINNNILIKVMTACANLEQEQHLLREQITKKKQPFYSNTLVCVEKIAPHFT